jgi:hypothetical protein
MTEQALAACLDVEKVTTANRAHVLGKLDPQALRRIEQLIKAKVLVARRSLCETFPLPINLAAGG